MSSVVAPHASGAPGASGVTVNRAHLSWVDRAVLAVAGGLLCFLALRTYDRVEALMDRVSRLEGVVEMIRERGR